MAAYYMLNKPMGYITARRDARHRTVMDLFPEEMRDELFPVGRLDKDTEGLLLVTDDGNLNHMLLSPENRVAKTYLFYAVGEIDTRKLSQLAIGARVFPGKEYVTAPAEVDILGNTTLGKIASLLPPSHASVARRKPYKSVTIGKVTITEGKKHQVKRMVAYTGGEVIYLKRLSIGGVNLDEALDYGSYRALTELELSILKNKAENV